MNVKDAHILLNKGLDVAPKRFFDVREGMTVSTGAIVRCVNFPYLDDESERYLTAQGDVFVFSHECDFAQENSRMFNDKLLICPLISFECWVEECVGSLTAEELTSLISSIARREVFRVVYLPCYALFKYGALMYLNDITNTSVKHVEKSCPAEVIEVTTEYGQGKIDQVLHNHLLRPYQDGKS